jgi:hypothetical protein
MSTMINAFRRRFVILAVPAWLAVALVLAIALRPMAALAFCVTFLVVTADFLWMSAGLGHVLGSAHVSTGSVFGFTAGVLARTLLLLVVLYGILTLLPREFLGVALGIGGPVMLLAIAGVLPTRG